MTGVLEILMQIFVSLVISVVVMIPLVVIIWTIRNYLVNKRVPYELKMKGGEIDNGKITTAKEETRRNYATDSYLRTYAERNYRGLARESGTSAGIRSGTVEEPYIIKRELSNSDAVKDGGDNRTIETTSGGWKKL